MKGELFKDLKVYDFGQKNQAYDAAIFFDSIALALALALVVIFTAVIFTAVIFTARSKLTNL